MIQGKDEADQAVVKAVERELQQWMKQIRETTSAVPTTAAELSRLRGRIAEASNALRTHSESTEALEWKETLASYKRVLAQLSAFLQEFEINLRIRRAELGAACGHANATSAWAAAVKRLG